jgi:hypothetical protein
MLQLLRARNDNLILRSADDEATTNGRSTQPDLGSGKRKIAATGGPQVQSRVRLVMLPNLILICPSVKGYKGRERQSRGARPARERTRPGGVQPKRRPTPAARRASGPMSRPCSRVLARMVVAEVALRTKGTTPDSIEERAGEGRVELPRCGSLPPMVEKRCGGAGPGASPHPGDDDIRRRIAARGSNDNRRRRGWTGEGGAARSHRAPPMVRRWLGAPHGAPPQPHTIKGSGGGGAGGVDGGTKPDARQGR